VKIRVLAVLAGLAVDFIGSVLFVVAVIVLASAVGRTDPILRGLSTATGLLAAYWIGLAFTLLGAFVTAKLSKPYCVLNTFLFGVVSTLPVLLAPSSPSFPRWYSVLGAVTILPISLAAGYAVAARSNQAMKRIAAD
jgi:hypothetical protein